MRFHRRNDHPFSNVWGAFDDFYRLSRQMERAFGSPSGTRRRAGTAGVFPLLNVSENADHYAIRAELPGVKSEDLDLTATEKSLTITGKRVSDVEEGGRYHRRERKSGEFSRVLGMPDRIDPEGIEAKVKNGVLTIRIPKAEAVKPRQITIN